MKFAQLVVGPAGSGKSTYCKIIQEHCYASKRKCRVVNFDPAAEVFEYECFLDVRELVKADDIMREMKLGPNGALVASMEYLMDNLDDLEEFFDAFADDDFLLIDCPGQIELYTHIPVMRQLTKSLQSWDFRVVGIYCMDVSFLTDAERFVAGATSALACMVELELPHVNVLTKCDILENKSIDLILKKEPEELLASLRKSMPPKYQQFNKALISLLDEFSLVSFATLNRDDEDSIATVLMVADQAIQYGEDLEPRELPEPVEAED